MAGMRVQDESNQVEPPLTEAPVEQVAHREAAALPTHDRVQELLGGRPPHAHRGDGLEFGSGEHQEQGNEGAKAAHQDAPHKAKADPRNAADPFLKFELTHGDIVMLSGDYFDPREKTERGEPVTDSLFRLAARPSRQVGHEVGTQDEIMYAIKDATPTDPRFAKGGNWEHVTFSQDVIDAVSSRYLQLAAHNAEHFANPDGKGGGPKSGNRHSAGGSYRALHEQAIHQAHRAQSVGEPIDTAMAHEAAAEHFLTDSFSAGHIRTPRESIATYWSGKYPLFFENLKKTIAKDVAVFVNDNEDNLATTFGSVRDFQEPLLQAIDAATAAMPAVGMDAIVATLTHDKDNEVGLDVRNDVGQKWHTFGDSHGAEGDTKPHVVKAVELGVNDIQHAYKIAPTAPEAKVEKEVRAQTPAPAKANQPKYGPEQLMPYPDPESKDNGKLGWKQPDFTTLWKTPVRNDQKDTYGDMIMKSMVDGDFGKQLTKLAKLFPPEQPVLHGVNTIHPQRAYEEGFLKPIQDPTRTQKKLDEIINYDPGKGVSGVDEDNATTADIERLQEQGVAQQQAGDRHANKETMLRGLTLDQRFNYIHNLESFQGKGTTDNEQDEIIELFETASKADRKALFKRLENRDWSGSLQGWKAWGDDIWINFDHAHIVRFDRMMNS